MSGLPSSKNADVIEEQASNWISQRELDSWSADDQAALDAWLSESLAHRVAFVRLEAGWKRTERLAALRAPMKELPKIQPSSRWNFLFRSAAAAVIVSAIGIAGATYFGRDPSRVFSTPIGGHEVVTLGDGSSIELNTNTIVRANGRSAELVQGEAYFQIKHDAVHPFVVKARGHQITDLGTAFIVRDEANRLVVRLVEGRAQIGSDAGGPSAILKPGDIAIASAKSLNVHTSTVQQLENTLSWRRGLLVFDQTTLSEAAAEFNRYNREKLVITDPSAGQITIGGTFPSNDVALFSRVAQAALGLRVETKGVDIIVSLPQKSVQ